mmetsp:Transcript_2639/g.5606  ORF Transcript_2639/g.5606 Transcript_2639/m.5606 type:complete len:295 (-) Transcript_2639:546-1430(-)
MSYGPLPRPAPHPARREEGGTSRWSGKIAAPRLRSTLFPSSLRMTPRSSGSRRGGRAIACTCCSAATMPIQGTFSGDFVSLHLLMFDVRRTFDSIFNLIHSAVLFRPQDAGQGRHPGRGSLRQGQPLHERLLRSLLSRGGHGPFRRPRVRLLLRRCRGWNGQRRAPSHHARRIGLARTWHRRQHARRHRRRGSAHDHCARKRKRSHCERGAGRRAGEHNGDAGYPTAERDPRRGDGRRRHQCGGNRCTTRRRCGRRADAGGSPGGHGGAGHGVPPVGVSRRATPVRTGVSGHYR